MALKYYRVGKRITDMPTSFNYNTESDIDIIGEPFFDATVGNPTTEATPITFNKDSPLAKWLNMAILFGYELSQLNKEFILVSIFMRVGADYETGKYFAVKQSATVVPNEDAMGNQSLQMSATINWTGARKFWTFDPTGGFVESATIPTASQIHYKDGDASRSDRALFFVYDDTE